MTCTAASLTPSCSFSTFAELCSRWGVENKPSPHPPPGKTLAWCQSSLAKQKKLDNQAPKHLYWLVTSTRVESPDWAFCLAQNFSSNCSELGGHCTSLSGSCLCLVSRALPEGILGCAVWAGGFNLHVPPHQEGSCSDLVWLSRFAPGKKW